MAKRPSTPVDEQPTRPRGPRELPLVALRETVIFPEMIVPLQVGREKSVNALNAAVADGGPDRARHPAPGRAGGHRRSRPSSTPIGTLAKIAQVVQLQDGTVRAIVQGQGAPARPRLHRRPSRTCARDDRGARRRQPRRPRGPGAHAHGPGPDRAVRRQRRPGPAGGRRRRPQHHRAGPAGRHGRLQPGHDHRAAPGAARDDRRRRAPQARLELPRQPDRDPRARRAGSSPRSSPRWTRPSASTSCASSSRPSSASWARTTRSRPRSTSCATRSRAAGMPEEIKARAIKEIDRMSRIPSASPEVGVIRTYVDWLIGLPWNVATDDQLDIKEAARILDEDHYGLEKIKERILEYLAVRTLADEIRSPILAFVGPPGVGKTVARQEHRAGDGPQVRPDEPRRHPRRGRDPRPPAHLHRRAARPDHPEHQDRPARTTRCSCSTRSTRSAWTSGATRASALLEVLDPEQNNTLPGQLPRGAVRPQQGALRRHRATCSTRSRRPCATGWRSSSCPATPSRRRSRSASASSSPSR